MLNQPNETLAILFPKFDTDFKKLNSSSALALLITFPGPEHIVRAG